MKYIKGWKESESMRSAMFATSACRDRIETEEILVSCCCLLLSCSHVRTSQNRRCRVNEDQSGLRVLAGRLGPHFGAIMSETPATKRKAVTAAWAEDTTIKTKVRKFADRSVEEQ
eukprot:6473828-Amphidinium_carterae.2